MSGGQGTPNRSTYTSRETFNRIAIALGGARIINGGARDLLQIELDVRIAVGLSVVIVGEEDFSVVRPSIGN